MSRKRRPASQDTGPGNAGGRESSPQPNDTMIPPLDRFDEQAQNHTMLRDALLAFPNAFEANHFDQLFHDLSRADPTWAAKLQQWWEPTKHSVRTQAARHDFHARYLSTAGTAWDSALEPLLAALFGGSSGGAGTLGRGSDPRNRMQ